MAMNLTSSRRSFVKGAAGGMAALVAAGSVPALALADEAASDDAAAASGVTDGTYSASSRGKHAPVTVEVTVSGGKISDIKISEHSEMPGMVESIEKDMLPLIVEHQTLNVDNVTAATVTSSAVLLAVADALGQAGFDVDALYDADYAAPVYEAPETTDADVIVIGAGGAGMNAALTAAAAGKSVIILEKLPSIGGNTQVSGGGMAAPCNWLQQEEGIEDSPELFEQDIITAVTTPTRTTTSCTYWPLAPSRPPSGCVTSTASSSTTSTSSVATPSCVRWFPRASRARRSPGRSRTTARRRASRSTATCVPPSSS